MRGEEESRQEEAEKHRWEPRPTGKWGKGKDPRTERKEEKRESGEKRRSNRKGQKLRRKGAM